MVICRNSLSNSPICSSDILAASKKLSAPQYPFHSLRAGKGHSLQDILNFGIIEIQLNLGQYRDKGFTEDLAEVFQGMKMYISDLEENMRYQNTLENYDRLQEIADQRNLIQHSLLCLSPATRAAGLSSDDCLLYDVYRVASLIFSTGIIFPIPYGGSPLPRLAKTLRYNLERLKPAQYQSTHVQGLLIWAVTLGGIAASHTPDRSWFVAKLKEVSLSSSVQCWSRLKRILRCVIWLDSACDIAGQQLWNETQEIQV